VKAQRFFWPLYLVLSLAAALAGSEAIASFIVPSWPARDMRPIEVAPVPDVAYNDWSLRDRPRSFERPADVRFRSILVGDSFLEGVFLGAPLSAFVEQRLAAAGLTNAEAINFGVSATGPRHYYYRIKNIGLALKPDAIVLTVFTGNDFVSTPFGGWMRPPIAELPLPSLLAGPAPRTTWLAVNRLGLSEFGRNNKIIDGEFAQLNEWLKLPADQRLDRIVQHLKRNYYPRLSEEAIREILSRGGDRFWTAFARPHPDQEFLAGWLLSGMIDWETGTWTMPRTAEEADRLDGTRMVDGKRRAARRRPDPGRDGRSRLCRLLAAVAQVLQHLAQRRCPPPAPGGEAAPDGGALLRPARRSQRRAGHLSADRRPLDGARHRDRGRSHLARAPEDARG
jgi:hypothetical protein